MIIFVVFFIYACLFVGGVSLLLGTAMVILGILKKGADLAQGTVGHTPKDTEDREVAALVGQMRADNNLIKNGLRIASFGVVCLMLLFVGCLAMIGSK